MINGFKLDIHKVLGFIRVITSAGNVFTGASLMLVLPRDHGNASFIQ